jgi:hypothetical protein
MKARIFTQLYIEINSLGNAIEITDWSIIILIMLGAKHLAHPAVTRDCERRDSQNSGMFCANHHTEIFLSQTSTQETCHEE